MNTQFQLGLGPFGPECIAWYVEANSTDLAPSDRLSVGPSEEPETPAEADVTFVLAGESISGEEPIFELFRPIIDPKKAISACRDALRSPGDRLAPVFKKVGR
jgi:hypothetical protein